MKNNLSVFIRLVLCVLLVSFIIYKVGFLSIINVLKNLNIFWLLPVFFIYFISIVLGACNIYLLLPLRKDLCYWRFLKYYLISSSVGMFTPGNIGEFYITKLLKKHKIKLSSSATITILDKLITVLVMAIISLVGIIFMFKYSINYLIPLTFLVLLILVSVLLINRKFFTILGFLFKKHKKSFGGSYKLLINLLKNKKINLFTNILLTFIKWFVTVIGIKLVFLSLGLNVDFLLILVVTASARLVSMIPITVDGLGVKESIAILMYGVYAIGSVYVASMYIVYFFINYSLALIVVLFHLLFYISSK